DRDALPMDTFFSLDVKYAGKSRTEKLDDIRKHMQKEGMTHFVLTSLDDIAWLFNIRGNDVPSNPVILSYAVITMDNAILFVNPDKVTPEMKKELNSQNVELKGYNDLCDYLKTLDKNSVVTYDADRTNVLITNSVPKDVEVIEEQNVTALAKAVKNPVEIENMKKAHIKDGVAMVKFLHWMDENVGKTKVTEVTADEKATEFRAKNENFMGKSFGTIAGYKEHAAMMHYSATPETAYDVQKEGMLLVDSGGQYLEGTTDITRTLVLGELSAEQKRDFTLVVRGVINLTLAKFLQGATGSHLDALCRAELWKYGIDYKCGTGHGIGFFLNVHEGPHRIANGNNTVSLREGMMVTNEPGVYNEGRYGIRTENVILVTKDEKTEHGQFLKFETLTMCPIDLRGIDKNYLAPEHIEWLNNYHKEVYEKLSPSLNEEEKAWLKNATRAI
ncbi:MAG: aminopeptidase family protein P, partial [Oscillospiraceae bacterium]